MSIKNARFPVQLSLREIAIGTAGVAVIVALLAPLVRSSFATSDPSNPFGPSSTNSQRESAELVKLIESTIPLPATDKPNSLELEINP